EIRNNADNLAYQCEKQLKDLGEKISAENKTEIEAKIATVREALKGTDTEAIKTAYMDLQNKFQSVSEELYKNAAASAGPGGPGAGADAGPQPGEESSSSSSSKKADGDVVDAEFEVVDEDK